MRQLALTATPFDHSNGVPEHTGMRGVMFDAETGFTSGLAFSTAFPTVFLGDNGDVEFGDTVVPARVAAQWFRALAYHLEEHTVGA